MITYLLLCFLPVALVIDKLAKERDKLKSATVDELKVCRSLCKKSFYKFVQEFWGVIIAEEPVWNWHIKYLCDELQILAEKVFKGEAREYDLIINIPPGTTKSTIVSIMFPAWTWTRMPSARHLNGSHTDQLVLDLSRKCRMILKSEKYRACFPEIKLSEDQDAKGYFTNTKGGMRLCCTVGGKNPMGFHAHFISIDDPIDPQKITSEAEIKSANDFMKDTVPSRKVDKNITVTILTMQRLHQNDPTGNWLDRCRSSKGVEKVKHICLPAELRCEDVIDEKTKEIIGKEWNCKPEELRHKYKNNLLDAVRLPENILLEYKAKGRFFYSGQFMQDPVPLGGGMFLTKKLHISSDVPKKFDRIVRYWDKAGTEGDGAYTAGVLMAVKYIPTPTGRESEFWVLDVQRFQEESATREKIIMDTAKIDGHSVMIGVEQEPGSGGKESAESTIKRLAGYRVRKDCPKGDKALRADPYSVQVNDGNVWLKIGEWNRDYIDEMRYFPESTYKDQIDASSGAFSLLTRFTQVGAY